MLSITPFAHIDVRESREPRTTRPRRGERTDPRPVKPAAFRIG